MRRSCLCDEGVAATLYFAEIVRQIFRIEFTFDNAVAAEQASISDIVPLRDQMRRDQNRLSALGVEAQFLLEPFSPTGIEAQPWFIEQKNWSIGEQQESDTQ